MKVKIKYSFFKIVLVLAVIFNIALPKGGFDISGIPITWGYIILGIIIIISLLKGLVLTKISIYRIQSFLLCLPFIIYFIIYLLYVDTYSLGSGYLISAIISFVFFPILFLLFFEPWINRILDDFDFFHKIILRAILFISVFGFILFSHKIITGVDYEIPYLTINNKDSGLIKWKHNARSDSMYKLFSTYNNGNIFGVCMLFLLPFTKNHKWHKILLKFVMVLTLSRTVWFGLIVYEMISYRKHILKMVTITLVVALAFVLVLVFLLGKDLGYLFDPTLNGRLDGHFFEKIHLFFYYKDFNGIAEMTYKSVLEQMGLVGVILFMIQVFSVLIVSYANKLFLYQNEYQNQLKVSILVYLIVAGIDGAYLLIPVSLFLWFFSSLILTKNTSIAKNE
ncbi:MAG: hypothetical protein ACOH2D_04390 [Gelidibacter sp.]